MPGGQGHHQHRSVRVPDDVWADLLEAARSGGYDNRAELLMALMLWYLRRPGAELPERPRE